MSSTDSAIARKVDDILRNQWTIYFGFSGRHAPDLVDDMLRIMQSDRLNPPGLGMNWVLSTPNHYTVDL